MFEMGEVSIDLAMTSLNIQSHEDCTWIVMIIEFIYFVMTMKKHINWMYWEDLKLLG